MIVAWLIAGLLALCAIAVTVAIRARIPLDVLRDTIQPFPTFSEIFVAALKALGDEVAGTA